MSVWTAVPLVVGHRGGRGEGWPTENTLDAFERARLQGAKAIELDTRRCSSGEAVVFHDETLERLTGGRDSRRIADVSLGELSRVDLVHGAHVPHLAEVLGWARANAIGVNVELKSDGGARMALALAVSRVMKDARADVLLSSFDPVLLGAIGVLVPRAPRALLTHSGQGIMGRLLQGTVRPPLARALHLEARSVGRDSLGPYLRRGLRIGVWTVNDASEAVRLVHEGASSIITDSPGLVLEALKDLHN